MTYSQGFYHLDECPRSSSTFAPCGCGLLRLQQKIAEANAPVEALPVVSDE
jgi:hypothetical protein